MDLLADFVVLLAKAQQLAELGFQLADLLPQGVELPLNWYHPDLAWQLTEEIAHVLVPETWAAPGVSVSGQFPEWFDGDTEVESLTEHLSPAARETFLGLSDTPDSYAEDGRAVVDAGRPRLLDQSI